MQPGVWLTDWEAAKAQAQRTNKPILINFTGSDWCGWCIRLKKEVFSQEEFKSWAGQKVVLFEADFPR
ncbi:MAG: thioredoxin family protein, partial [Candidatus Eremiobacteraeota bacterium]|nr:thioredoxin family protein [Candidatus Eremiobacteraeota bacterium]